MRGQVKPINPKFETKTFALTDDHVKLLREACVSWNGCEYGSPTIDPKRPYGNSDVEGDIAEILGWKKVDFDGDLMWSHRQLELAGSIHRQMRLALQVVLSTGQFTPGVYVSNRYENNWHYQGPLP